jgi:hypothetical protein
MSSNEGLGRHFKRRHSLLRLEVDDVNYDFDEEDRNECNHDTDLIDANVMNNDEPEGRTRSIRRKVVPARLKECMF